MNHALERGCSERAKINNDTNARGEIMGSINRRQFLAGASAMALAAMAGERMFAAPGDTPPNIVFLIADNLGWRDLSCYGDTNYSSPHTDRLAEQGVMFTNAFVSAPSCSPSRTTMISGQSPHSVGTLGLTHLDASFQMSTDVPTLPRTLQQAGYRTGIIGKWHVAPFKSPSAYGYHKHLSPMEIKSADPALKFIDMAKEKPFYLEMNFMQTHRPSPNHAYRQHPDFPIDPDAIHVPDYWSLPDWPEIREDVAAYYSQAAWMDRIVGEVMAKLEREGLRENTLVIYVSDNGPMYPGGIGACYDRGIATPLILSWPAGLPQGRVVHGLASTIDIMPTCLQAAGVDIPQCVQGASLLPISRGETDIVHDAIFAEMTHHVLYTPMRVIRTPYYKYIENLNNVPVGLDMCEDFEWAHRVAELPDQPCCRPRSPEELYDLKNDPNELDNLIYKAEAPDLSPLQAELREQLHQWRRDTNDPLPVT